jgi:hypothetical protein
MTSSAGLNLQPLGSWDSRTHGNRGVCRGLSDTCQRMEHGVPWALEHDDIPRQHAGTPLDDLGRFHNSTKLRLVDICRHQQSWRLLSTVHFSESRPAFGTLAFHHATLYPSCFTTHCWLLLCCVNSHMLICDRLHSLEVTRTDFIWKTPPYMSLVFRKIISIPEFVDVRFEDVTFTKTAILFLWAVTPCKLPKRTTSSLVALLTRNRQSNQTSCPACTFSGV